MKESEKGLAAAAGDFLYLVLQLLAIFFTLVTLMVGALPAEPLDPLTPDDGLEEPLGFVLEALEPLLLVPDAAADDEDGVPLTSTSSPTWLLNLEVSPAS
jgi:hypothetical protein